MLAVRVERREHLGARSASCVLDAGLDSRALPQIYRMRDDVRACGKREIARAVLAPVVDADDVVENGADIGDDVADDARLVIGGYDDPNILVARVDAD